MILDAHFDPNNPQSSNDRFLEIPKSTPDAYISPAPVVSTTFVFIGWILIRLVSFWIRAPSSPILITASLPREAIRFAVSSGEE